MPRFFTSDGTTIRYGGRIVATIDAGRAARALHELYGVSPELARAIASGGLKARSNVLALAQAHGLVQ